MHMRKIIILIFAIIFTISGCSASKKSNNGFVKNESKESVKQIKKIVKPIKKLIPGEKLTYKISWLGIHVGRATLEVLKDNSVAGENTCKVFLRAKTNKFFSLIYNVDGKIESIVNAVTFKPIKYDSQTQINKKFVFKKMFYDFNRLKVYAEDKKGQYVIDITENTLDPLGVFYYFRKNQVKLNDPVDIVVNGGKKNFSVRIYAKRERYIRTAAGRFWAFQIEPTEESERQFDDSLNAEGSMRIWFSSDEFRLPLIILLKLPVGSAQATLIDVQYP